MKIGTISEALDVRISGHIPTIRRNSTAVKFIEVMKSTADLMSAKEAVATGGWSFMMERKSMPMESRKSSFSWKSEWWSRWGVGGGMGGDNGGMSGVREGSLEGKMKVVLELEMMGNWSVRERERQGKIEEGEEWWWMNPPLERR